MVGPPARAVVARHPARLDAEGDPLGADELLDGPGQAVGGGHPAAVLHLGPQPEAAADQVDDSKENRRKKRAILERFGLASFIVGEWDSAFESNKKLVSLATDTKPKLAGVPGLTAWVRMTPISESTVCTTTLAARVTGEVAPHNGSAGQTSGIPLRAVATIRSPY